MPINRRMLAVIATALAAILFVAVNVLGNTALRSTRLDLTEDALFTLSDGTREVLRSIDETITVRLYASKALAEKAPVYAEYIDRVTELLEHYRAVSGDMLRLEVLDPEPYSVAEDEALAYGLQGIPLNNGESVYFGLAASNSTDDQETIPFFDTRREQHLEYDLTRLIYNLAHPEKRVVGLIAGHPIDRHPLKDFQPLAVVEQIRQFFDLRKIDVSATALPEGLDVLMIVHPHSLKDELLYAIDQFVMKGGRLIVFADPFPRAEGELMSTMRSAIPAPASNLSKLFDAWGVEVTREQFVADKGTAVSVEAESDGRRVVSDHVAWLNLGPRNFNSEDVITAQLERVFMQSTGAISARDGADIEIVPLISSSSNAALMPAMKLRTDVSPPDLAREFESENRSFVLAGRVRGIVPSAFPDGAPKPEDDSGADAGAAESGDQAKAPGHLARSEGPVNMIVVADIDLLSDSSWLQVQEFFGRRLTLPTANNAAFVVNALDNLAGSNALIALRSRGLSVRPFTRVEELQEAAEQRYRKTEQALQARLKTMEEKLGQVERGGPEGRVQLTDEQKATVNDIRSELLETRRQLREVQHNLRKDIESLETRLKVFNIWAVPAAASLVALVVAWVRRRRFRRLAQEG